MKKFLIRAFCLVLCLLMIVPLASCNDTNEKKPDSNTDNDTTTPPSDEDKNPPEEDKNPDDDDPGKEDDPPAPPVDTREEVDMDKLIELLTTSIYSANVKTAEFVGLTDPSLVGVNKDQVDDVLYPIPDDKDCSVVINVKDYGILPNGEDCSTAFKDVIKAVKGKTGIKKIVFPEGDYKFKQTIALGNMEDVYICSESNDKRFSITMTNWVAGIKVENCTNIHFNNYDFDYETPSIITGTVAKKSGNKITINVDEGYDLTQKNFNGGKVNYGSYMEFTYDEKFDKYVPSGNLLYNSTGDPWNNAMLDGSYDSSTRQLTLTFKENRVGNVSAGTKVNVAYTMYEYFGFQAINCENVYVEGVTMYHSMGMAMGMSSVKNAYLNRFQLTPKEGRLMTATADGFHCGSCSGEIIVTNSVFESSHDDCFNIKGAYGKVLSNTPKSISYDSSKTILVNEGDVLDFYSNTNFKYLGTYTVKSINTGRNTYTIKEAIPADVDLTNAYIVNDTQINSLTVRNCYFGNKRNRGMLIQCRDIEISGCTFQNFVHPAIMIFSTADHFAEGIMPKNAVVKNCKFMNNKDLGVYVFTNGPEGAVPNTIMNVEVSNNFFFGDRVTPVSFRSAGDSSIKNNFFYNFNTGLKRVIYIDVSENVTVEKNYVKGTTSEPEFEPVTVNPDSTANIIVDKNISEVAKAE